MPITAKAPGYLQARNLVSVSVSGGTAAESGDITWATAVDLAVVAVSGTKTFEEFSWSVDPTHEMIKTADGTVASYQIEYDDFNVTVREITPANGVGNLAAIGAAYDYFRVVAVYRPRGATTGGSCVSLVGVRAPLQGGINPGKNTQSIALKPIGYPLYIGAVGTQPY